MQKLGETPEIKKLNAGDRKQVRVDEEDDLMELFETLRDRDETMPGDCKRAAEAHGMTLAKLCKDCGECAGIENIKRRINCRDKAADQGKTLAMVCHTCKCECN